MNRRKRIAFEVALGGISTALALICIVLYYYIPLAKISLLALAGVALLLPLTADSLRSAALAYASAVGLSIAVIGPIPALPFIFLFGWQPIVMGFCLRYIPKRWYIAIPIKAALFNLGLFGTYQLYGLGETITRAAAKWGWTPAYWIIAIAGTALWLLYDYAMIWILRWLSRRLEKVTAKYKPQKKSRNSEEEIAPHAPIFDEFEDIAQERRDGQTPKQSDDTASQDGAMDNDDTSSSGHRKCDHDADTDSND